MGSVRPQSASAQAVAEARDLFPVVPPSVAALTEAGLAEPAESQVRVCAKALARDSSEDLSPVLPLASSSEPVESPAPPESAAPAETPLEAVLTLVSPAPTEAASHDGASDAAPAPDAEVSVPPVVLQDQDTDDLLSEAFFAAPAPLHTVSHADALIFAAEPGDLAELDAHDPKAMPHVVARRARLTSYVAWVVGAASLLCAAAAVSSLLSPSPSSAAPVAAAASLPHGAVGTVDAGAVR